MTLWDMKQARGYQTDKSQSYLDAYERFFAPWRQHTVNLLEIGVHKGESLRLWRDYFPQGRIVGLDLDLTRTFENFANLAEGIGPRIYLYQGNQSDARRLGEIVGWTTHHGFDIIIDDGSHLAKDAAASFEALFNVHLKPGGIYAIEDWGVGYRADWPDGAELDPQIPDLRFPSLREHDGQRAIHVWHSHQAGMVGWVKQLVDEMCLGRSPIESIHLQHGLAILRKKVA